jgi:phosphoribosylanthranilate isomerase
MKIKICGMREPANIRAIAGLKPDYMGLIFYRGSKRFVNGADPELVESLPSGIKMTGVFVNETLETVLDKMKQYSLKSIQLHGQETSGYCSSLQKALRAQDPDIELIKAFGIDQDFDFNILKKYLPVIDFFLFDTKTPAHGGSGLKFNWEILKGYSFEKPYFLSGGIGLDDLQQLKDLNDDRLYAVDLNSRFETSPGLKDTDQVSLAIEIIRAD